MGKLRREVNGPPNLDTVILNIQRVTRQIHAAYLFEQIGKPTLQKLCLLLSSTATDKIYNGWQDFAAHMGLSIEQIRVCKYLMLIILINLCFFVNLFITVYRL